MHKLQDTMFFFNSFPVFFFFNRVPTVKNLSTNPKVPFDRDMALFQTIGALQDPVVFEHLKKPGGTLW